VSRSKTSAVSQDINGLRVRITETELEFYWNGEVNPRPKMPGILRHPPL
jgi:hypothetical protein